MTDKWNVLANYNAERARGIVHTPEWDELMREHQEAFDEEQRLKIELFKAEQRILRLLPNRIIHLGKAEKQA